MVYSDTTTKLGIIQRIEYWTNLGDAGISGDATLLKVITGNVNAAFDELMPLLLSYTDNIRWDDTNHTANQWGTFAITSGQADYNLSSDGSSLAILNVARVQIRTSASATAYVELEKMTIDDDAALDALTGANSGVPTKWLERNNAIYFDNKPNYTNSAGIRAFFEREQSYFASTDTIKEPGIPKPFHPLLPMIASLDWLIVNKPDNQVLISRLENKIAVAKQELRDMISMKTPIVSRVRPPYQDNR